METVLLAAAKALPWALVALGIARGLFLVGRGTVARWRSGWRALCSDKLVRRGSTMLSAAGSCGGFLTVAMGWPL